MKVAELSQDLAKVGEMQQLYGHFSLDINTGRPTANWEAGNLTNMRLPFPLQSVWFPTFFFHRVKVNRRAVTALSRVFADLAQKYSLEALREEGLDQFVRCYEFGAGTPSLFWYGAGWQLSPKVAGDTLAQTIRLFVNHGFHYEGIDDKKRLREFEFW